MKTFFSIFLILLCIACNDNTRKSELNRRQLIIDEKEQSLVELEKKLLIREQQLAQREKTIDSLQRNLNQNDSVVSPVDSVEYASLFGGLWSVRLDCTLSTCENFAVGDTKTETWNLGTDGKRVVAQVVSALPGTKIFTGSVEQHTLYLQETLQPSDSNAVSKNELRLNILSNNEISGERELTRQNCRVLYKVLMRKQ